MPVSLASVMTVEDGDLKMTLLIEMPFSALLRSLIQRTKSFIDSLSIFADLNLSALSFRRRSRFIKCLADGMTKQACSRRPTSVLRESYVAHFFMMMSCIDFFQAVAFSVGRPIVKSLVFISQPKKISISAKPPSARSFLTEAMGERSIGSFSGSRGRQVKKSDMRLQRRALSTIALFSKVSSTIEVPSSMYPSVPPLRSEGSLMSASRASPKGRSSGRRAGWGTSSWRGGASLLGSQSSQFMRSSARSKVHSENWEKIAGAGEDPNGSLVSIDPTFWTDFDKISPRSFILWRNQVEQHLAATLGEA